MIPILYVVCAVLDGEVDSKGAATTNADSHSRANIKGRRKYPESDEDEGRSRNSIENCNRETSVW